MRGRQGCRDAQPGIKAPGAAAWAPGWDDTHGRWEPAPIFVTYVVQLLNCVRLFATPWTVARQASLSITISQRLLKLMSIESVLIPNHFILCNPRFLLPLIFPSIRFFPNESALHIRWPKYWSFSFSISPSKEHPGLISFSMDWLDLFFLQSNGLSRVFSRPQFKSIDSLVLSFLHSPTLASIRDHWKTHSLRWTFVGKAMSLLLNMLSRLVMTFLPRSKHLLISWLQSHLQ